MLMHPAGFKLQDRGRYLFDRWQWPEPVHTRVGNLLVELTSADGLPPDAAMVGAANDLANFAASNGDLLLDLIFGHYRFADENGWLEFWGVPIKLSRDHVLSQVRSVELIVHRDDEGTCESAVFVDPLWDVEHKLDLIYRDDSIILINDEPFDLIDGVVRFK